MPFLGREKGQTKILGTNFFRDLKLWRPKFLDLVFLSLNIASIFCPRKGFSIKFFLELISLDLQLEPILFVEKSICTKKMQPHHSFKPTIFSGLPNLVWAPN